MTRPSAARRESHPPETAEGAGRRRPARALASCAAFARDRWLAPADSAGSEGQRPPALDARALWWAGGAWAGAWVLVRHGLPTAVFVACAGSAVLVALLWVLLRDKGLVAWGRHLWTPLALFLAGTTLAAASVAGHGLASADPTLAAHLAGGDTIRFSARLLEDPREVESPSRFSSEDRGGEPARSEPGDTSSSRGVPMGAPTDATGGGRKLAAPHASLMAAARLERYAAAGHWRSASAEVVLVLSGAHTAGAQPVRGNLVEGLGRASAAPAEDRGALWIRSTSTARVVEEPVASDPARSLRARFLDIAAVLPADGPALLPGMVMGDRSGQEDDLSDAMKSSGLVHLTAVSGANCAMILGAVLWLARATGLGRGVAFLASMVCLVGFVVLVRPEPSVVRAAVMGAVAAAAVYAGRGRQAFAALCACVVALLVWNPWYAGEPAFQLSVLATAGIVVLGRPLALVLRRAMPGWLADGTSVCVSAQVFCMPVLVGLSADLPVYSVAANILVAPLVPVVTVVGTCGLLLSALPTPLVLPFVWGSGLPAALVGTIGRNVAALPGATVPWPEGGAGQAAAAFLAALAVVSSWLATAGRRAVRGPDDGAAAAAAPERAGLPHPHARTGAVATGTVALALLAGITVPATALDPTGPGPWDVALCDVGQGDALALRTGDRSAVVVDTGPDPAAVDDCLKGLGIDAVDALFVTHLHADHDGGVAGVFNGRRVDRTYFSSADPAESPPGVPPTHRVLRAHAGNSGREGPVDWVVISPRPGEASPSENDASLVVLFTLAEHPAATGARRQRPTLLATGDIETEAMRQVLGEHPELRADVLKVSHHGARNGGTDVVEQVGAKIALISVGADNNYGHPAPETLAALEGAGMATFRTDLSGTLLLRFTDRGTAEVVGTAIGGSRSGFP